MRLLLLLLLSTCTGCTPLMLAMKADKETGAIYVRATHVVGVYGAKCFTPGITYVEDEDKVLRGYLCGPVAKPGDVFGVSPSHIRQLK